MQFQINRQQNLQVRRKHGLLVLASRVPCWVLEREQKLLLFGTVLYEHANGGDYLHLLSAASVCILFWEYEILVKWFSLIYYGMSLHMYMYAFASQHFLVC